MKSLRKPTKRDMGFKNHHYYCFILKENSVEVHEFPLGLDFRLTIKIRVVDCSSH
jgi:hypothetical protein